MGQYHEIWAAMPDGSFETFDHYAVGNGAKLAEQAYLTTLSNGVRVTSPVVIGLGSMVMHGAWKGVPLCVIGDYASEPDDIVPAFGDAPVGRFYGQPRDPDGWDSIPELPGAAVDRTEHVRGILGEGYALGFTPSRPGGGWCRIEWDGATEERFCTLAEMGERDPGDGVLYAAGANEYLEPKPFGSTANPLTSFVVGALWPAAYIMLAKSDGRGGGDFRFRPAGRWSGSSLMLIERSAIPDDATDVTDWVLGQDRFVGWVMGDG